VKLLVLSDLHIEFAEFRPVETDADVVVLAGDIGTKLSGMKMAQSSFGDRPVIYVAGNHEYYGAAIPHMTEKLRQLAAGTSVHFLENDEAVIGGVRFLGCTLWTDFQLLGPERRETCRWEAEEKMTDYRRIRLSPRFRRLRTHDTCTMHALSRKWLDTALSTRFDGPTVVVTHHAPSWTSIPERYRADPLSAAYATDLSAWMKGKPIDLWIHGHTHNRLDYVVSGIRVVSNQRGYVDELAADFDPGSVVEVGHDEKILGSEDAC
jgi:predicted phosphodiesterase